MSAISVDITSLEARVWLAESMEADALLGLVEQLCTIRMNRHLALDDKGMPTCTAREMYLAERFEKVALEAKCAKRVIGALQAEQKATGLEACATTEKAEEKTPRAAEEAASGGTRGGGA